MDTTPSYLEIRILEWQFQLGRTSLTHDDQEELKVHLDDIIHELFGLNLSDEEIWVVAMKRIGSIATIEEEFEKVNPDLGFRKNGMLLIYGAVSMLFLQCIFIFIPVFYYKKHQIKPGIPDSKNAHYFWPLLFYILAFLLVCLMLALIIKGKSIMKYLSSLIPRLNITSAFVSVTITILSGFYLIQLLNIGAVDTATDAASAFKTMTQVFYLGQIALIGYFLLVSNKHEIRNLLSFNRKINWKIALFLGSCAGIAFTFGYTYHLEYLPLIIGIPLFSIVGWMISYSKNPLPNLFFSQVYIMILWGSEVFGRYAAIFTKFYLIILLFLFVGFTYQKVYGLLKISIKR